MKKENKKDNFSKIINRKEAIRKGVKLTALTAATLVFLETKNASAVSTPPSAGDGFRNPSR